MECYCESDEANSDLVWADGEEKVLRVEVTDLGDACKADYYVDGILVGSLATACNDTIALCVAVFAGTRANDGSNTVDIDYIYATQDR